MPDRWRFIDSGRCEASLNMALDESLASGVRAGVVPPTLRLYGWQRPSLTIGTFQKISDIDVGYCSEQQIPVVRRPTGGRAILHGDELTYSFSVRTDCEPFNTGLLSSYRIVSEAFNLALREMGISSSSKLRREKGSVLSGSAFCFESSSYGEILISGRKAVGSAQKRWEDGLLQQGSIPYAVDDELMARVLNVRTPRFPGSYMVGLKEVLPAFDENRFRQAVRDSFEEIFGISFVPAHPTGEELSLARKLQQEKYLSRAWNLRL